MQRQQQQHSRRNAVEEIEAENDHQHHTHNYNEIGEVMEVENDVSSSGGHRKMYTKRWRMTRDQSIMIILHAPK